MTSPIKRKLRNKVKATRNKDDEVEKQLQELALDGKMDAIMGFVLQRKCNFDTIIKEKIYKAFADWNYNSVMNYFCIKTVAYTYTPLSCLCPDKLIDEVECTMMKLKKIRGQPTQLNDRGKEKFIDAVITAVVGELGCFIVRDEVLSGFEGHGNVFMTGSNCSCLLLEARKDDIRQGFAQLFIEMFTAHRMNASHGFKQSRFYGILSTGATWFFVEFCSDKKPAFTSSEPFSVRLEHRESLAEVVNILYAFVLTAYIKSVDAWVLRARAMATIVETDNDPNPEKGDYSEVPTTKFTESVSLCKEQISKALNTCDNEDASSIMEDIKQSVEKINDWMEKWEADIDI